jgi:hypothetical protein
MELTKDISNDMFLVENCSTLQERLGRVLQEAYPHETELYDVVVNHLNPVRMQADLLEMFTPKALMIMFQTEMGKGVIIGAFIQKHLGDLNEESDR